jgi:uncharacterized protein (DUF362 family)
MTQQTRRDFLARTAAATGALALVGGRGLRAAEAAGADMAIAKWAGAASPSADDIRKIAVQLTLKALEGVGGLKRFMSKGAVVWVKPNIGWDRAPETAANTNPDVVATIIKACFEAGAKTVKVGDNTVNLAAKCYASSGIADAAKAVGAQVLFLDKSRYKEMDIQGEKIKKIGVYPEVIESDLVINVPVVKHHRLSAATMCMKNYMGVIDDRKAIHQDIPTCLADITRFLKPRLCILDAVRILTGNGPSGGDLKDVQTKLMVAAGVDIVALDAWGAEVMGKKPEEIGSVAAGAKAGLGKIDYKAIAKEVPVS